jgi:CBS domain-containing protein
MKLVSLLDEKLISISREVSPIGDSIEELLGLIVSGHSIESEMKSLMRKLESQIKRGGLIIGHKVSFFHLVIPEVETSCLAMKSMGGQEGMILFLLSTPRSSPKFYLQVSAALQTFSRDRPLLNRFKGAENPGDLLDIIGETDIVLNPRIVVKDVMRKDLPTVESDAPLSAVVEHMVFKGLGGMVVTDASEKVLGVITESDLIQVFLPELMATLGESDQRSDDPVQQVGIGERYKVKDFMTRSVMCVSEDAPITEVATLMINKKVSRLPVVKEGKLVGIASLKDIIRQVLRGWFV